jgi:hypothetical protein
MGGYMMLDKRLLLKREELLAFLKAKALEEGIGKLSQSLGKSSSYLYHTFGKARPNPSIALFIALADKLGYDVVLREKQLSIPGQDTVRSVHHEPPR